MSFFNVSHVIGVLDDVPLFLKKALHAYHKPLVHCSRQESDSPTQHDFLVGSWLFCIQRLPCLVSCRCMHGGLNEEHSILYQFIEGQAHFGMPRGAQMSMALNEPKLVALHSNSNIFHHKWK